MLCHCRTGHMRKLDRASHPELPGRAFDLDDLSGRCWPRPAQPRCASCHPGDSGHIERMKPRHVDGTDDHLRDRRFSPRTRKENGCEPYEIPLIPLDANGKQTKPQRSDNEIQRLAAPTAFDGFIALLRQRQKALNPMAQEVLLEVVLSRGARAGPAESTRGARPTTGLQQF